MSTLNVSNITDGTDTVETGYVLNGSAKAWLADYRDDGGAIGGSFNISSVTDSGTGWATVNFANNFDSAEFSHVASDSFYGLCQTEPNSQTVSTGRVVSYSNTFALRDTAKNSVAHGDLA